MSWIIPQVNRPNMYVFIFLSFICTFFTSEGLSVLMAIEILISISFANKVLDKIDENKKPE